MERKEDFVVGSFYHIYNRGVDKKNIFRTDGDRKHFQRLLYTRNSSKRINSARVKGLPLHTIGRGDTITDVVAYCLMPNHFHLLLREKIDGGISVFMAKFSTAFSMYINTKYNRTGPLMCRPFRSKQVDDDDYFRWLFSYIHLNPVELVQPDFKEQGITHSSKTQAFLNTYPFSSYVDYFIGNREETHILTFDREVQSLVKENGSVRELEIMCKDSPYIYERW